MRAGGPRPQVRAVMARDDPNERLSRISAVWSLPARKIEP
jgi:hypothetical protein